MQVKRYITPVTNKIRKGNDYRQQNGNLMGINVCEQAETRKGAPVLSRIWGDLYIPLDFKYWMNLKRWKAAGRLEHGSLHTHPRKPNAKLYMNNISSGSSIVVVVVW